MMTAGRSSIGTVDGGQSVYWGRGGRTETCCVQKVVGVVKGMWAGKDTTGHS